MQEVGVAVATGKEGAGGLRSSWQKCLGFLGPFVGVVEGVSKWGSAAESLGFPTPQSRGGGT